MEFEWDAGNEDHIALHDVTPDEAEEALADPHRVRQDAYSVPGEARRGACGATQSGRVLYVVFTLRWGRIRVVTARDASERECRGYRRARRHGR
ncbi:MAG: BrnT family toxin [Chloroflexota bacterium]